MSGKKLLCGKRDQRVRAYYIGAFSVGGPILRVIVKGRINAENNLDLWECAVSSPNGRASAWPKGLRLEVSGHNLFDSWKPVSPFRIAYAGQQWRDIIADGHYARDLAASGNGPAFRLSRAGSEY